MFYENFVALCESINKTPTTVAKEMGFTANAPYAWKQGKSPSSKSLKRIANYFGVTTDELLMEPGTSPITREHGVKIGVLSKVAAGIPLERIDLFDPDDPSAWEEITEHQASGGEYFALRIKGDSMTPRIRHGDIVIVRKQERVEEGETAVVLINGDEGVCKRIHFRDDGIQLLSNNPEYKPRFYSWEEVKTKPVQIVGLVEEIRGKP